MLRIKGWGLSHKSERITTLSTPTPQRLKKWHRRGVKKTVNPRGWGRMQWNAVFWRNHDYHTHKLQYLLITCTKSNQLKSSSNGGGILQTWTLTRCHQQLISCCRRIFLSFSLRILTLVGLPYSSWWPHSQEHIGNSNWTLGGDIKFGRDILERIWRKQKKGDGGKYISLYICMKFSKIII